MENSLSKLLDDMNDKKVLIVGDLMLDKFIWGDISRVSAESPVPIIKVERVTYNSGGSGNTANNIVSLGGKVIVVGIIGNDAEGEILLKELKNKNVDCDGIFIDKSKPTIQKVRVMGQSQHLIRLDYEDDNYINGKIEIEIIKFIEDKICDADIVIISDYIKGTITEQVAKILVELANGHKKSIVVDTKPKHAHFYKNVTLVKPNLKEAIEMSGTDNLMEIGNKLKEFFNANILVTKGKDGMSLFLKDGKYLEIPTKAREVYDVGGAGDTVIATLGLALGANAMLEDAVNLANIAAGIVVEKRGVVPIDRDELRDHLKIPVYPKVWGEERWLANEDYCGKLLILKNGYRCSLHYHKNKDETFYIIKGKILLELSGKKIIMGPGASQRIKPNEVHRFSGLEDSEILEISTHHDENDSYRIELSGKME